MCTQETVDTSDAAYEKRHRKYETFEKRQRLREKEKLKHEHYKLKERIEQLRAMDPSSFLTIPASEFTEAHGDAPGPSAQPEVPVDAANLHGAAAYQEGERRRKEMLEVALSLEQRYRTLLPPDRRWMEKKLDKSPRKRNSIDVMEIDVEEDEAEEAAYDDEDEGEDEVEMQEEEEVDESEPESEAESEAEPEPEDEGESELDPDEIEERRSKKLKLRIKFPAGMLSVKQEPKPPPSRGGGKQITLSPFFKHTGGGKGPTALSPLRSASYAGPHTSSKYGRYSVESDTLPQVPSAKRQRVSASTTASAKSKSSKAYNGSSARDSVSSGGRLPRTSYSPVRSYASYAGLAGKREQQTCVLMVAAIRQSSAPTARKTQRHVTAFGTRVPPELEEVRDFEIPSWVLASGSASEDGDRQGSYDNMGSIAEDSDSASDAGSDPGS